MHEDRIRWLNERLPRKRAIGQGLIRDAQGRVLLCQMTYKEAWDLPGGVVEPAESPRVGCLREVAEELGVELQSRGLVAINWMSPWRGWDDACTYLFDLGVHDVELPRRLHLQPTEIAAVHWCHLDEPLHQVGEATARLLRAVAGVTAEALPLYLEDGWPT